MSEFDFDAELREMLETEQVKYQADIEKSAYKSVPLNTFRLELLEDFYDHLIEVSAAKQDELTAENLFKPSHTKSMKRTAAEVDELLQFDIERQGDKLLGEMEVKGLVPFFVKPKVNEYEAHDQILGDGEVIRGTAVGYRVHTMASYNTFIGYRNESESALEENEEQPSEDLVLILLLKGVRVIDQNGMQLATYEQAIVPYSYPGIEVNGLVYVKDDERLPQPEPFEITEHLNGGIFIELSNDIENNFNYNDYEEDELREKRYESQMQLEAFMEVMDKDTPLLLSADIAMNLEGEEILLENVVAYYDQTTIIKNGPIWRVAHGFTLINFDGDGHNTIVHVLPENLRSIKRQ